MRSFRGTIYLANREPRFKGIKPLEFLPNLWSRAPERHRTVRDLTVGSLTVGLPHRSERSWPSMVAHGPADSRKANAQVPFWRRRPGFALSRLGHEHRARKPHMGPVTGVQQASRSRLGAREVTVPTPPLAVGVSVFSGTVLNRDRRDANRETERWLWGQEGDRTGRGKRNRIMTCERHRRASGNLQRSCHHPRLTPTNALKRPSH